MRPIRRLDWTEDCWPTMGENGSCEVPKEDDVYGNRDWDVIRNWAKNAKKLSANTIAKKGTRNYLE